MKTRYALFIFREEQGPSNWGKAASTQLQKKDAEGNLEKKITDFGGVLLSDTDLQEDQGKLLKIQSPDSLQCICANQGAKFVMRL